MYLASRSRHDDQLWLILDDRQPSHWTHGRLCKPTRAQVIQIDHFHVIVRHLPSRADHDGRSRRQIAAADHGGRSRRQTTKSRIYMADHGGRLRSRIYTWQITSSELASTHDRLRATSPCRHAADHEQIASTRGRLRDARVDTRQTTSNELASTHGRSRDARLDARQITSSSHRHTATHEQRPRGCARQITSSDLAAAHGRLRAASSRRRALICRTD